jgi:hypothetical protein
MQKFFLKQGTIDSGENGRRYHMCYPSGDSTRAETDLPHTVGRSESGSAPSSPSDDRRRLSGTGASLATGRLRQLRQLLPLQAPVRLHMLIRAGTRRGPVP